MLNRSFIVNTSTYVHRSSVVSTISTEGFHLTQQNYSSRNRTHIPINADSQNVNKMYYCIAINRCNI